MKRYIMAVLICIVLLGCNKMAPKCESAEVQDLVLEISWEELISQWAMFNMGIDLKETITIELDAIRTSEVDKDTGKYSCAANVVMTNIADGATEDLPITYTVEKTDDDGFYVNVLGLR